MKRSLILLSLCAIVCSPAQAQTRTRSRVVVASKAQISGITNPERCLVPTGCAEDTAQDALRSSGPPVVFLGTQIPDSAFYKPPTVWSYERLPSDCLVLGNAGAYVTVFDSDFTTTQGSDRLVVALNGQAVIFGGNAAGFADSIFLKCTVTQGSTTTACPTTASEPAIVQQVDTPTRVPQLVFFSYTGSLQVARNTATNVKIEVSSFATAGQVCFASLMNGF